MYLTEFFSMHTMYGSSSYNQNFLNVMEVILKHIFMEIILTPACGAMMQPLRELILVYAIKIRIIKLIHSTL